MASSALADKRVKPTHIMTLDSDVLTPLDLLVRLVAHRLPVVAGLYYSRGKFAGKFDQTGEPHSTYFPVMAYKENEEEPWEVAAKESRWRSSSLYTDLMVVDGTGLGCMLVEAGVFAKLQKPWYNMPVSQDGETVLCGEDYWFCDRLKQAGFEVIVDTTIEGIMHHCDGWVGAPGHLYDTADLMTGPEASQ